MTQTYVPPFSRSDQSLLARWFWTVDRGLVIAALSLMGIGVALSFASSPAAIMADEGLSNPFHYSIRMIAFVAAGVGQFGSGWAWVAVKNGKLEIMKTPNGENPLVHGATPILGVDVWEHSYYIDYRNARPKYLEAFVDNLINWDHVLDCYEKAS